MRNTTRTGRLAGRLSSGTSLIAVLVAVIVPGANYAHAQTVVTVNDDTSLDATTDASAISHIIVNADGALTTDDFTLDRNRSGNLLDVNGGTAEVTGGAFVNTSTGAGHNALIVRNGGSVTGSGAAFASSGSFTGPGEASAAMYAHSGGTVALSTGSAETTGDFGYAVRTIGDGSAIGLIDFVVTTSGLQGIGVQAFGDHRAATSTAVTVSGSTISTEGTKAFGAQAARIGASVELTDTDIFTEGDDAVGILVDRGASAGFAGGSVTTVGDHAHGAFASHKEPYGGGGEGASSITLTDAEIETGGAYATGVYTIGSQVEIEGSTIETNGLWSHGVHAMSSTFNDDSAAPATISIANSSIFTLNEKGMGTKDGDGSRAYALFAEGAGANIQASNVTVHTKGQRAYGAYALGGGQVEIEDSSITTDGFVAYGVYASGEGSEINATNLNITTNGQVGDAAWAYDGGVLNLSGGTFTIYGGPSGTADETANGLLTFGGGAIYAEGIDITTKGTDGSGILAGAHLGAGGSTSAGYVEFSDGSIVTEGADAAAAKVRFGSTLQLTNTSLASQQGHGLVLTDDAQVTMFGTTLTSAEASILSRFTTSEQQQSILIGAGSTVTQTTPDGLLLDVVRDAGGKDGVVTLTLAAGSTSTGDIIDRDFEEDGAFGAGAEEGWTDVILQAGANWSGQAIVRNFFDLSGGEANFGDGSTLGSLQANGSNYSFGEGVEIITDVSLSSGSSTTGGSVSSPVVVGGNVVVDNTSTLGGSWNISGSFTSNGNTSPGNSPGEITVGEDVAFGPDHVLLIELTSEPDNDRVNSGGTMALDGDLLFAALGGVTFGHAYEFLSADEFVGDFDSIDFERDYVFFADPVVLDTVDGDTEMRTVTINRNDTSIADVAGTTNQASVAAVLDGLSADDPSNDSDDRVLNTVLVSASANAVRANLDSLSGEVHASLLGALVNDGHMLAETAIERLRKATPGDAPRVMSYVPQAALYGDEALPSPVSMWGRASGSKLSVDATANTGAVDARSMGILFGVETVIDAGWTVGGMVGYGQTSVELGSRSSSAQSDAFHAGLYGGTEWDNFTFRLGANYSGHAVATTRKVIVGLDAQTLEADYSVHGGHLFAEIGHRFVVQNAALEPFLRLEHTRLSSTHYQESGGDAALDGSGGGMDATFAMIGAYGSTSVALGEGTVAELKGMVGYRHALNAVGPSATHSLSASDAFTVTGAPFSSAFVVGAGATVGLSDTATIGINFTGEIGEASQAHSGRATLSVRF